MERLNSLAEEFRSSLKEHHEESFENTTNQDMRREIHDMQTLRDVTNNMINMNRLRMFLQGMEELESVLLFLEYPGATSVMSNVWGAVNFLLKDWRTFEAEESSQKHEQRHEIITWISASGKMPRLQQTFRDMVICPNSGRWLFRKYSAVSDWMGEDDPPDSTIWLHEKIGFGKSVLASLVVQELQDPDTHFSIPSGSRACYFYCQEDDNEHRTHLDILKGILLQMVESDDYILPLCHQEKNTSGGANLLDAGVAKKLIKTFIEYSPRQYIVIDGLDECEGTEIHQTARFFKELVSVYDTQVRLGHLRVIFIGRETSDTRKYIPGDDCASVPLKPDDNHDDIRAFVQKRMPEFSTSEYSQGFSLSEANKEDIERIVCHQSQDSFLYAYLAIEFLLQQDTKGDLLTLLRQGILPTELGAMYEKLLEGLKTRLQSQRGGEAQWQRSKSLLGWLVCAKRPLRWHEMQAILCFDERELKVDFENKMMRKDVEKYLGSIIHVLDGDNIRLIHSSARHHIIQNKYIQEKLVQCQLATTCLRYLTVSCFGNSYISTQRSEHAKGGWFAFQDYACSQWLYHIDTVIRECSDLFQDPCQVTMDFVLALEHFVNTHRSEITAPEHIDLGDDVISNFLNLDFYGDLRLVWNHIYTHQRGDYSTRNKIGIAQIENAIKDNRTELERFLPDQRVGDEDTVKHYYGANLFKCRRTLCRFFYIGYDKKAARDNHEKRHERPFQCPISCSSAPLGFVSNKDRDRHINIYHPNHSESSSHFEVLSRRQVPGKFTFLEIYWSI
ncbi:early growth response 1-b [Fusarium sporotrichioides]|uniref:Early growth response 1-b n=1 Tax=Fusarium sporotrichioides TaxID=5514 RepID=A0A395SCJ4_FUSSP|nr:early growth response 1-b [Fusarium sporotrichioides]